MNGTIREAIILETLADFQNPATTEELVRAACLNRVGLTETLKGLPKYVSRLSDQNEDRWQFIDARAKKEALIVAKKIQEGKWTR